MNFSRNSLCFLAVLALIFSHTGNALAQTKNWSGGYLGLHVGGADHSVDWTDLADDWITGRRSFGSKGFVAGAVAGWNFQRGDVVYGVEADFSLGNISDRSTPAEYNGNYDGIIYNKVNWLSTIRGRVGLVRDRMLFFATAGVAIEDLTARLESVTYPDEEFGNILGVKVGWVGGAGIEYAATDAMSINIQGLYHRFGNDRAGQMSDPDEIMVVSDQSIVTVRVGVNFKFSTAPN